MSTIDILAFAYDDKNNNLFKYFQCMKSIGVNIVAYKVIPSIHAYPEQVPIYPDLQSALISKTPYVVACKKLLNFINISKVIWFYDAFFVDTGIVDFDNMNVIVSYEPDVYYNGAEICNSFFNDIVKKSIIHSPSLLGFNAKNEFFVSFIADTEHIKQNVNMQHENIVVGCFTRRNSNDDIKAVNNIVGQIHNHFGDLFKFIIVNDAMEWIDIFRLMSQCDVIIESVYTEHGDWGSIALTAASFGCIVIGNSYFNDVYEQEYGKCEILIANNQDEIIKKLNDIYYMGYDARLIKKNMTRKWAENYHSIKFVASRLYENVFKELL